jgi:tetratricopeptide (TPR) repeat protein
MEPPKVDDAVAAYRKALEFDPKNATAALGIGIAYYASERYDEAIQAFEEAKRIAPEVAPVADAYLAAIERIKKGTGPGPTPTPPPEADLSLLAERIQSRDANVRLRAAKDLCRLGRDAVDLLVWATANDSSWDVRDLAVTCLGNVGPGARAATPYLRTSSGRPGKPWRRSSADRDSRSGHP